VVAFRGGHYDQGVTTPSFEQGPIRPPSEAHSLLVRVIRNCTWNRCTFCPVYKGAKASRRPLDDVLADVDAMAAAAEALRGGALGGGRVGGRGGDAGSPPRDGSMVAALRSGELPPEAHQVALFLRDGARSAFLQDADPCAVAPGKLAAVVTRVRERFPTVMRVTTYGRARTLARRTPEQLALLAGIGLSRVHLGLESGSDEVLERIDKGCTAAELITAGERVLGAGMELCFYFMPGLGGRELATAHVRGTAAVVRAVAAAAPAERPLVVRLRTTAVVEGTPLAAHEVAGAFELPDDVEIAVELRELLAQLDGARLELRSDHALNLFPEFEGSLPADRDRLVDLLDRFLALSRVEQAEFSLGRRLGVYRTLDDRLDPDRRAALEARAPGAGEAEAAVKLDVAKRIRSRFL
jgi:hypothetical protein